MISIATAAAFFDEFATKSKTNETLGMELIADFAVREPNVVAFMATVFSGDVIKNPATAGLLAMVLYERLRKRQEDADLLEKDVSNGKS